MKYALNLDKDDGNRILSATYASYAPKDAVLVEELPEGNMADYRYVEGEYIYDPLPEPETPEPETPEQGATLEDRVTDLETGSAEMREALEMILSGVTE